jgi:hypothetical protein
MLKKIIPFFIGLFLIISPALALDRNCTTNDTLRQYFVYTVNGANVTGTQDLHCTFGCDFTTDQCKGGNLLNIWMLGAMVGVAAYLMFGRKDAILNILGALFIAIVGAYMITSGVLIGFTNTQSDSFLMKDYFTNALGILFICIAIYKLAMGWIHMNDASG